MFRFNPMLEEMRMMYEITLPLCKSGFLIPKNKSIPDNPYVPTSHDHHLHKERVLEALTCCSHNFLYITISSSLINLCAEIALKEKMHPILIRSKRAHNTILIIGDLPLSSLQQITCV
jgi:hypothetical protein